MNSSITYQINLKVVGDDIIGSVTAEIDKMTRSTKKATKSFGDCFKSLLAVSQVAEGLSILEQQFNNLIQPGVSLNTNMAELSAITGVTGEGLKEIERAARATSKTFGTDASANVESYKLVLSQLDPEIAKNSEAMKLMGDNINVLSKQMKGDTVMATNVLTTSMNQFGVSTKDPIQAAKVMGEMMNTMSAAAQAGSAELPQIKEAMGAVGAVAKSTGLSFEETNALIQATDKFASKSGAEGGTAIRNILQSLSKGRFTTKEAKEGLEAAGISVEYLADKSVPLTDKLRTLKKIQGDTALVGKVFEQANVGTALALIENADAVDELTQQITGTNSAVEQADIIMGSYSEKMGRMKAKFDDIKIGIFNATESFAPFLQGLFSSFNALGQIAVSGNAVITTLRYANIRLTYNTIATKINTLFKKRLRKANMRASLSSIRLATSNKITSFYMLAGAVASRIQASGIRSVARAFGQATLGAVGFQIALDALGIGLVLLAIAGLIAGLKYLWEHSRRFREILYGIGNAGKAVFHNIGVFAKRLWNLVIKPIALAYWNIYKWVFTNIWNVVKAVFNGIRTAILSAWNSVIKPVAIWIHDIYTKVFRAIFNTVVTVFNGIKSFATGVWNWITATFGTFGAWVEETIIDPIYNAFTNVWDWLTTLLNNIMNKLSSVFKPIVALWNQLFSSKGMSDISVAYKEGEKAGGESFDRDKVTSKNNTAPQKVEIAKNPFDLKGSGTNTPTLGGAAVKSLDKGSSVGGSGSKSDSGNKVRNLTIGKMMENFNVHMNASHGIDKTQLLNAVREVLLTASADFAGAN